MSSTAFVFPGQGSQYVGMGKDFFEHSQESKDLFTHADEILGYKLSAICFDGPEDLLRQTEHTQPAIFLHSMAASRQIQEPHAEMVAGHSLGEYSALVYAGALSFDDGLKLVRLRGQLMQKAGSEQKGTMAAVVGLTMEAVLNLCEDAKIKGIVQAANFNSPGQVVISGSVPGVYEAMKIAKERGAKLVKELVVSGAFHSPLMESATEGLKNALESTAVQNAKMPVYANVSAHPMTNADEIRNLLCRQITSPVRWEETIQNMVRDGSSSFLEVGPGKVLQGLIKRTNSSVSISGIDKFADLKN